MSDGLSSPVEHVADLATQEEQCDDGDHGDERQDQCVFGEALAPAVTSDQRDECEKLRHEGIRASFPQDSSAEAEGAPETKDRRYHVGTGGSRIAELA